MKTHHINKRDKSQQGASKATRKDTELNIALTWIINGDIIHGQRFRDVGSGFCCALAFVGRRGIVGIIDQDREQDQKQQLEQAAYDAELQAHFHLFVYRRCGMSDE